MQKRSFTFDLCPLIEADMLPISVQDLGPDHEQHRDLVGSPAVRLHDVMEAILYGGIREVRYAGRDIAPARIADGVPFMRAGRHCIGIPRVGDANGEQPFEFILEGPRDGEAALPGSVLHAYDAEPSEPSVDKREALRARADRLLDVRENDGRYSRHERRQALVAELQKGDHAKKIQLEINRRLADVDRRLSDAGKRGDLVFFGKRWNGRERDLTASSQTALLRIPPSYFDRIRGFGLDGRVNAVSIPDSDEGEVTTFLDAADKGRAEAWVDVRVSRASLLRWLKTQWSHSPAHQPPVSSATEERKCFDFLISEIDQSPDKGRWPKAEYRKKAVAGDFGFRISGRGFDQQWRAAIRSYPECRWSSAGAPKKQAS